MKFIDEARIKVKAGNGGPGCKSFRREKFVPFGGPDGGDGGGGGSIYLVGDRNKHTLIDFHFNPLYRAEKGGQGSGNNRKGHTGEDLLIHVPLGTEAYNQASGELIADITDHDQKIVLAQGGRGGKGNAFFKSATNQAPEHTQPGETGEESEILLSLKLIADVGLLGFPNAGKSTLISRVSSARPKIADYPFTTLVPQLGVVKAPARSFVIADIPGLIPGAHTGKGLGVQFLKHVERTGLLVHLIDATQVNDDGTPCNAYENYRAINFELESFSPELAKIPQIIVLSKHDAIDEERRQEVLKEFKAHDIAPLEISSVSGFGIDLLLNTITSNLK
jgi:GTP-binding protein